MPTSMKAVLILACTLLARPALGQDTEREWRLNTRLQGSFNDQGQILKSDTSVAFDLNRHWTVDAGLPIYFVKNSTTELEAGLGNARLGFRFSANNDALRYTSSLVSTAPTGDRSKGFSTGHVTVDWSHTVSGTVSSFTPYGSLGIANTVSDTSFFVRPFSTDGMVTHFEGGLFYDPSLFVSIGASGYGVRARGTQEIIVRQATGPRGRTVQVTSTFTPTANDHGFSAWFSLIPEGRLDYEIGYSRSAAYDLNSLFFSIGLRLK